MSKISDGGPAFPRALATARLSDGSQEISSPQPGISIRDYFAAKVLAGYLANSEESGAEPTLVWLADDAHDPIAIARVCYRMADAMLRARESK